MNFHQVATPELGVDEARCYMFFFREGEKLSAYIVLYMPSTERRLFYTYSSNPFPEADLPMVEEIARAFGEEMGFFLDEKSFTSSSVAEKNLWIDEQPLFGFKTPEEREDAARTEETAAEPAAQTPPPTAPVKEGADTITAPAPPVAQQIPLATEYQPAPAAPSPPAPPSPPAAPEYNQPAPPLPTSQPMPVTVYQQVPSPPAPPAPPAAPVYYQPVPPPAPAAPQTPPQPVYSKEIEIEPQVEIEEEVNARPPRQKSTAVPHSSTERAKTAGAAPRAARPLRSNPHEEEYQCSTEDPSAETAD